MTTEVHASSIIHPDTKIHNSCKVGPYAIIEEGVKIGEGCDIQSHAIIKMNTVLGKNVTAGHFSVIGGDPQHLEFDKTINSIVRVEDNVRISEGVTIHRSLYPGGTTIIGSDCFLMGNSHVGHDCELQENVILANGALLGGHVKVGRFAFIGGGAGIHQFTRIGSGTMIGGLAEVSKDVPPYIIVSGRNEACGLNLIGLKRQNVSANEIKVLKYAYRSILMRSGKLDEKAKECLADEQILNSQMAKEFVEFFITKRRGFVKSRSKSSM